MSQNTTNRTSWNVKVDYVTADGKRLTETMKSSDYIERFESGEFYSLHSVRQVRR